MVTIIENSNAIIDQSIQTNDVKSDVKETINVNIEPHILKHKNATKQDLKQIKDPTMNNTKLNNSIIKMQIATTNSATSSVNDATRNPSQETSLFYSELDAGEAGGGGVDVEDAGGSGDGEAAGRESILKRNCGKHGGWQQMSDKILHFTNI